MDVGVFTHCIGDAHIYIDHVEALHEQSSRDPFPFPRLTILKQGSVVLYGREKCDVIKEVLGRVEGVEWCDVGVLGYESWGAVKMKMSV